MQFSFVVLFYGHGSSFYYRVSLSSSDLEMRMRERTKSRPVLGVFLLIFCFIRIDKLVEWM